MPARIRTAKPTHTKEAIKDHMRTLVRVDRVGYDFQTGEINSTLLAEYAADDFGHIEWLDDDLHIIWDAAVEVADEFEIK